MVQKHKEFLFLCNDVGKLLPNIRKVNAALEVSHIYNICLLNCLPKQALHQYALAAARVAANQNMRGLVNINNHITRQATPKNQLVVLIAQNIAFMPFDGIKNVFRWNAAQAHRSAVITLFNAGYQHIKGAFKFKLFVYPSGHGKARAVICQYSSITTLFFLNQIRGFSCAVREPNAGKIVLHFQRPRHIANGGSANGSPTQIGKCCRYKHKSRKCSGQMVRPVDCRAQCRPQQQEHKQGMALAGRHNCIVQPCLYGIAEVVQVGTSTQFIVVQIRHGRSPFSVRCVGEEDNVAPNPPMWDSAHNQFQHHQYQDSGGSS